MCSPQSSHSVAGYSVCSCGGEGRGGEGAIGGEGRGGEGGTHLVGAQVTERPVCVAHSLLTL